MKTKKLIDVAKLTPGIYVGLPLHWTQHPFLFSRFMIATWAEVHQIQALGLDQVHCDPAKSNLTHKVQDDARTAGTQSSVNDTDDSDLWQEKQKSIEQADQFRRDRKKAAQRYHETKKRINNMMLDLTTAPANAVRDCELLIADLTVQFNQEASMLINLVNMSEASYSINNHALNVTVLSLVLGHSMGMSTDELKILGMGALLHDIGKVALPARIAKKPQNMSKVEQDLFSTHVGQGIKLVHRIENIRPEIMEIIGHHHSFLDGSGFPEQVAVEKISQSARIVTIANLYDNYCNPSDLAEALTPKEAMAHLYAQAGEQLDEKLVQGFIRTFGVYPPGTVVLLSDDSFALVLVVASKALLTPRVVLYNPDVPADKAMVIDLIEHPNLQIIRALRPTEYPARIYNYLGIQERVGYYFESLVQ
jgi:putative nucleotidyltransferase with HDIG domain